MSDRPSKPPRRTKSGESAAVRTFRDKIDSIQEGTFPALEELNRQAEELKAKSEPPKDPRRDGDEEIPVDVVEETDLEAPTPKTPKETPKS
jgi:hypothetical protein